MKLLRYGEDGIRLVFGAGPDPLVHEEVKRWDCFLRFLALPGVVDVIPSFASCLIRFDCDRISFGTLKAILEEREGEASRTKVPPSTSHEIPVVYDRNRGTDMDFVCSYSGLSPEEVIEIHSSATYTVFATGFMPGFPYMGVLDRRLYVPRLDTPRLKVPAGSVGIARLQTGIYPFESPAGWRVIGRTDYALFDHRKEPYSLLRMGDTVRFVPL